MSRAEAYFVEYSFFSFFEKYANVFKLLNLESNNKSTHHPLAGFLEDQKEFEEKLRRNNMTLASTLYGTGMERANRFYLNNLSFAGPVIMGIGGKKIILVYKCFKLCLRLSINLG